MNRLQSIAQLSKSGIVTLVLISVLGGYLIGHPLERDFDWLKLVITLFAILLLASGSSALNQIQERDIDAQMKRTQKRPLPSGALSLKMAMFFTLSSIIAGLILSYVVGMKIALLGALAVITYNGLYTLWWKKKMAFAAIPGAIPGALPILIGYAAAADAVMTPQGMYLFGLLFFWQMPHFWALAIRYQEDYESGGIPTLPVILGENVTKDQIRIWTLAYLGLALVSPLFLPVSWIGFAINLIVSLKTWKELRGFLSDGAPANAWVKFFIWINLSLILFLGSLVLDSWKVYLEIPFR